MGRSRILCRLRGPDDGVHLLFYGHSWSDAATIWPTAHFLSPLLCLFAPHSVRCPSWFSFPLAIFSQLLIVQLELLFHSVPIISLTLSASSLDHCPDVLFMVCSHDSLIYGSRPPCAPRRQNGRGEWMEGARGPLGAQTARHRGNMSPSCLMTSTIQPCRALIVHLRP